MAKSYQDYLRINIFTAVFIMANLMPFSIVAGQHAFHQFVQSETLSQRVQGLITSGRTQEAIWELEETGHKIQADRLKRLLFEALYSSRHRITQKFEIFGVESKNFVKIDEDVYGILKHFDRAAIEVFAYLLSVKLGWNLVPMTLFPKGAQNQASLQLLILKSRQTRLEPQELYKLEPRLAALDFLLANTDRNKGNSLYTRDGRIVAIDHGHALDPSLTQKELKELFPIELIPSEYIESILALPENFGRQILSPRSYQIFLKQLKRVKNFWVSNNKCQNAVLKVVEI